MTSDELSNIDIEKFFTSKTTGKITRKWGGCYISDDVANMTPEEGKVYVINIDNEMNEKLRGERGIVGTHWVAVANLRKRKILYFDSFGFPPPKRIEKFMKKSNNPGTGEPKLIEYNSRQIQDISESSCGYWAVWFVKQMILDQSFARVISSDQIKNFELWRNEDELSGLKRKHLHYL